jgi:SAM-dependent methyltransferase
MITKLTVDNPTMAAAGARAAARAAFPDWRFAPNQGGHPGIYETENRGIDPDGHVLAAMRRIAPWDGRTVLDLGCGTGFWLPGYAKDARRVIGVEPDPVLRAKAAARVAGLPGVDVVPGSAERLPLADRSVEVVHARFAYFLDPGAEGGTADAGLAEVMRVLTPGGSLVVVDNDYRWGEFAGLLAAASRRPPRDTAAAVDGWWRQRGAARYEVRSRWRFASRADLAAVLNIEVPAGVARSWLARNPAATGLTYGYVLFCASRSPAGPLEVSRSPARPLEVSRSPARPLQGIALRVLCGPCPVGIGALGWLWVGQPSGADETVHPEPARQRPWSLPFFMKAAGLGGGGPPPGGHSRGYADRHQQPPRRGLPAADRAERVAG